MCIRDRYNYGYRSLSTASSSSTTQGTLWVRELRSICEELELHWSFLLRILHSHFQSHELQRCHKQAGASSPLATTLPIPNFKFLLAFLRIFVAVVRLKRMGNWVEIVISLLVLSLTFQFKANDCVRTHFVYLFTC